MTSMGPGCSFLRISTVLDRSDQALALLTKMESRGLTPDVVSYASAMRACDRAGEWQVRCS